MQQCGEIVMSLTMTALVIIPFAIFIAVIAMNTAQTARAGAAAEAAPEALPEPSEEEGSLTKIRHLRAKG